MEVPYRYISPNGVFLYFCFFIHGFFTGILLTNGLRTHSVIQTEDVLLECNSSTNLERTWYFDNDLKINFNRIIFEDVFKKNSEITETYSLLIKNVSIEHEGVYQCRKDSQILANHSVYVRVIPTIQVTINGVDPISPYVTVPRNESIAATCLASNARPKVNITWLVNNEKVKSSAIQNQTISTNSENNNTFDTLSSIRFQHDGKTGNITCVIYGLTEQGLSSHWEFQVEKDQSTEDDKKFSSSLGPPTIDTPNLKIAFIITPSIFLVVISFAVVACIVKKTKASEKSRVHMDLNNVSLEESSAASLDTDRATVRQRSPDYSRRLTLGLTGSHDVINTYDPDYTFLPDLDGENYSKLQDNTSKGRNFNAKDMCLLLNMKTGPVYNKWMGTVAIDNDDTKSVVISTVTDHTLRSKEVHWDEYVKRILDLPSNKNIVTVVGICIDTVSLYLLHEHVACETLDKRIQTTKAVDSSKVNLMTPFEVLLYVRGILEGMEMLHSYGFLHPGLTTKKILVTDEGACKLYDFCLSNDAYKIVAIAKTQKVDSLNHFAPETLLRNAYTQACDVWSVGVVIWEIFSGGSHPFPSTNESVSSYGTLPFPPAVWPEGYQKLKNRRVFDCWEEEVALRPSLNQLRLSFAKISESLEPCENKPGVMASTALVEDSGDAYTDENTYE